MTVDEAAQKYGPIVNGHWVNADQWCVLFQVPLDISSLWINSITGKSTVHVYMNKDLVGPFAESLRNVRDRGLIGELKTFDGCFMERDVRGSPGVPSAHTYALAVDINAKTNPLGQTGDMSFALGQCFTDCGLFWGRRFTRKDSMHFSLLDW